jgi:hypothetical protein
MRFSAYLRQPYHVSVEEKNAYVEEVIQLLELEDLADGVLPSSHMFVCRDELVPFTDLVANIAMIGFPGFGLGVEARKRLTIGVELAARPELLLFLDGKRLSPFVSTRICLAEKNHSFRQNPRPVWMDKVLTTLFDSYASSPVLDKPSCRLYPAINSPC